MAQFCSYHRPKPLGLLEQRMLSALWTQGPSTVRELRHAVPRRGYTTLMTTLDRLYKKGILTRARRGYANVYTPVMGRQEFHATIARHVLIWLRVSET